MTGDRLLTSIRRVPCLLKVTPEALAIACAGFPFEPKHGYPWLARAIQGALFYTLPPEPIGCEQVSGLEPVELTRTEMRDNARKLRRKLEAAHDAVIKSHKMIGFAKADAAELALAEALEAIEAVANSEPDRPRAREKQNRELRIERAYQLAPIFEDGFGAKAVVNDWPGAAAGPWPEFYQRMNELIFDEPKTPDLRRVLKTARRMTLLFGPPTFAPGQIPEHPL